MTYHALIVDDDSEIRCLTSEFLSKNGFAVSQACNSTEAEFLLKQFKFDIIILDVLMPKEKGTTFLKRKKSLHCPVIMLTALSDVDDRIQGLESGAEDYLSKPFEPRELLIRIHKIIDRKVNVEEKSATVNFGIYAFNKKNSSLIELNSKKRLHITTNEKKLLTLFTSNIGVVISRKEIAFNLNEVSTRTIDTQIARLRSKIENNPKKPEFLQTIRNQGYVFWGNLV